MIDDNLYTMSDKMGNSLTCKDGYLSLKLVSEHRVRSIGRIYKHDGEFCYLKFQKQEDIFQKFNAWGFNHSLLRMLPMNTKVFVIDERNKYGARSSAILERGKFLHFKKQGFELQIFMPLAEFIIAPK